MNNTLRTAAILFTIITALTLKAAAADRVKVSAGVVEGAGPQRSTGVRIFRGIPFAQPPTGDLRWREPQQVKSWRGVKQAKSFGPRCVQAPVFGDMGFRSTTMSEDCLYLNVWTPARWRGWGGRRSGRSATARAPFPAPAHGGLGIEYPPVAS